jgi:ubiquilin
LYTPTALLVFINRLFPVGIMSSASGSADNNDASIEASAATPNVSTLTIHVRLTNGVKFTTNVSLPINRSEGAASPKNSDTLSVGGLKDWLLEQHPEECQPATSTRMIRLIYKGRILHDDSVAVSDAGVVNGSTVFLVTTATKGNAVGSPTKTGNSALVTLSTAAHASTVVNDTGNAGTSSNADDMDTPTTAAAPDVLQLMTEGNPALRELAASNPTIRHALSDPSVMRDLWNAATNPHARAQQERSHDLQLAQIENMPGGMAALASMYNQVQAPLNDSLLSTTPSQASSSEQLPSAENRMAGASGTAMPNPWGNRNTSNSGMPNQNMNSLMQSLMTGSNNASSGGNDINRLLQSMMGNDGMGRTGGMGPNTGMPHPRGPVAAAGGLPSVEEREALMATMEQNPSMVAMMQQMVAQNPGMVRAMMANQMSPSQAAMLDGLSDQQLSQMVSQSLNPDHMRSMMQMEQMLQSMGLVAPQPPPSFLSPQPIVPAYNPWAANSLAPASSGTVSQSGAASSSNGTPPPLLDFGSLLQQGFPPFPGAAASLPVQQPNHDRPLQQLRDMGFDNDESILLTALRSAHGNLNRAVEILLATPAPETEAAASGTSDNDQVSPTGPSEKKND